MYGYSDQLKKICENEGIELTEHADGHFVIHGKYEVHYWPNSKNQTCYIKGKWQSTWKNVSPAQAVKRAEGRPKRINPHPGPQQRFMEEEYSPFPKREFKPNGTWPELREVAKAMLKKYFGR